MASLRDIRKRIASVKNTQKITKAMKMVAAAKLKRSQDRILAARPYAHKMRGVLSNLSQRVNRSSHPLLQKREGKKVEVLGVGSTPGWYIIRNPYFHKPCWVQAANLKNVPADTTALPVMTPGP